MDNGKWYSDLWLAEGYNFVPLPPLVLDLQSGAAGFQLSNPPVLQCMALLSSLNVFKETSMSELCQKSRILTGYLELLLEENLGKRQALKRKTNQDGH